MLYSHKQKSIKCSTLEYHNRKDLDQFLGLEEALEMSHLPGAHDKEDGGLSQGPPEHCT